MQFKCVILACCKQGFSIAYSGFKAVFELASKPVDLMSGKEESRFQSIVLSMIKKSDHVREGKMMSSPGIKYKEKVFAFFYRNQMVFRLGKNYKPIDNGIFEYSLLSPFKNKPPMSGWFVIPYHYKEKWEELSIQAMNLLDGDVL